MCQQYHSMSCLQLPTALSGQSMSLSPGRCPTSETGAAVVTPGLPGSQLRGGTGHCPPRETMASDPRELPAPVVSSHYCKCCQQRSVTWMFFFTFLNTSKAHPSGKERVFKFPASTYLMQYFKHQIKRLSLKTVTLEEEGELSLLPIAEQFSPVCSL